MDLVAHSAGTRAAIAYAARYPDRVASMLLITRLFPNGEAVVIDDCGHYPWVEQPESFRRAADPFVS